MDRTLGRSPWVSLVLSFLKVCPQEPDGPGLCSSVVFLLSKGPFFATFAVTAMWGRSSVVSCAALGSVDGEDTVVVVALNQAVNLGVWLCLPCGASSPPALVSGCTELGESPMVLVLSSAAGAWEGCPATARGPHGQHQTLKR